MAYSKELINRQRREREALSDRQREERRALTRQHEAEKEAERQARQAEKEAERAQRQVEKEAPVERARLCRKLCAVRQDAAETIAAMDAQCTTDLERVAYLREILGESKDSPLL